MHTKRPKPRTWRPEGPRGPRGFRRRAHAAPWRTREHGRPRGLEKRLKNGVRARPARQKLRGGTSVLAPVLREAACVTPRARRTPATAAVPGASLDSRPHEHRPGAAVSPPICALCKEVKTATRTWQLVTLQGRGGPCRTKGTVPVGVSAGRETAGAPKEKGLRQPRSQEVTRTVAPAGRAPSGPPRRTPLPHSAFWWPFAAGLLASASLGVFDKCSL